MQKTDNEKEMQVEFVEFIEANQVAPSKENDKAVMDMVDRDLNPPLSMVYGKFVLIQTFSGLLTLTVCPQFGIGLAPHNEFLHSLHASMPPTAFYLLCGVFFVLMGGILSGMLLGRVEIQAVGNKKFISFAAFGVLAYIALTVLGTEAFLVSSLTWVLGALLGNLIGFEVTTLLRMSNAKPISIA